MIDLLSQYGLFLLKTVTLLIAILIVIAAVAQTAQKQKADGGIFVIENINEKFQDVKKAFLAEILTKADYKHWLKGNKKAHKSEEKKEKKQKKQKKSPDNKNRLFVLRFDGDIKASHTLALTECINALIDCAKPEDEVLLVLESAGGFVHSYGHAAAQVHRIRDHNLKLTIAIDKCAASGGYLMACLADTIIASPFAIIGSIGVIGQIPNFHKVLKKNNIEYEMHTAGEFKRTLTMFGENTDKARGKFIEDIQVTHDLFKDHVARNRPMVDITEVATGEHWHAIQAYEKKLVDKIQTSDAFIMASLPDKQIYEISYKEKQKLSDKMMSNLSAQLGTAIGNWLNKMKFLKV